MTKQYGNATFGTMVSCLILGGRLLVFLNKLLKNGDITALNIAASALVLDTLVTKSIPKEAQHSFSTCCFEGLLIFTFFFLNLTQLPVVPSFTPTRITFPQLKYWSVSLPAVRSEMVLSYSSPKCCLETV